MGWDIDRFPEGEVNLELICCICTCILEDPVESPCRHVFCSQCIKTWLSNQKSCPHCRAPVHKRDLQSVVPLLKNIISKQKIYCDNRTRGCSDVIALESLPGHIASCPYGLVTCTYEGCNVRVLRKDIKAHTEVCSKRTVMCEEGCEMFLLQGEQNSHNCIQALRAHFLEVTNELLGRVSKLEELLNDIVVKNTSSNNRHHHHHYQHHRGGGGGGNRDNNDTFDCVSYNIPSPQSFTSDRGPYTVLDNDTDQPITIEPFGNDNNDFSDSVESIESDTAGNDRRNTYMPTRSNMPSPRRTNITYDADMSPTIARGINNPTNTYESVLLVNRQHDPRDGDTPDPRRRPRPRSRSPHQRDNLESTYVSNNNVNVRRRGYREQRQRNGNDADDTVVLRIGVSQTVSDSSSSSSSSTDSDTD